MGKVDCERINLYINYSHRQCKIKNIYVNSNEKAIFFILLLANKLINNDMKGYLENLKGLHIKYIMINIIISLAGFISTLIIGEIGLGTKIDTYLSIILMAGIMICFIKGRKTYQKELRKMKDLVLGKKLNAYQDSNKKVLKYFTYMTCLATIGLVLSCEIRYLVFCLLSVLLIFLNRTNKAKLGYELNLTKEEVEKLVNSISQKDKSSKKGSK